MHGKTWSESVITSLYVPAALDYEVMLGHTQKVKKNTFFNSGFYALPKPSIINSGMAQINARSFRRTGFASIPGTPSSTVRLSYEVS